MNPVSCADSLRIHGNAFTQGAEAGALLTCLLIACVIVGYLFGRGSGK